MKKKRENNNTENFKEDLIGGSFVVIVINLSQPHTHSHRSRIFVLV